jgi:hypothetical protein
MKTIAIIIRAHGRIPLMFDPNFNYTSEAGLIQFKLELIDVGSMFSKFDYKKKFNISNVTHVVSSEVGGVCYGSSDVENFITNVNKHYRDDITTDTKITEIFGPIGSRPEGLKPHIEKLFGRSSDPSIIQSTHSVMINKKYTRYDENSGVFLLSQNGLHGFNLIRIKQEFHQLSETLRDGGQIAKADILKVIANNGFDNVYIIDLTCNVYLNEHNSKGQLVSIENPTVNLIHGFLVGNNITGGFKNRLKYKKYKRSKRSKKNKKIRNNKTTKSKK